MSSPHGFKHKGEAFPSAVDGVALGRRSSSNDDVSDSRDADQKPQEVTRSAVRFFCGVALLLAVGVAVFLDVNITHARYTEVTEIESEVSMMMVFKGQNYTSDMADNTSKAFYDFQQKFCSQVVDTALRNTSQIQFDNSQCTVKSLWLGSVKVNFTFVVIVKQSTGQTSKHFFTDVFNSSKPRMSREWKYELLEFFNIIVKQITDYAHTSTLAVDATTAAAASPSTAMTTTTQLTTPPTPPPPPATTSMATPATTTPPATTPMATPATTTPPATTSKATPATTVTSACPACSTPFDQAASTGRWTVFQRRCHGCENFNRTWAEYQAGFGNPAGEFWLGLNSLRSLTLDGTYEARFDVQQFSGVTGYAVYSNFTVGSSSQNFTLNFNTKTGGNLTDEVSSFNKGEPFGTPDRDRTGSNCAAMYQAGWWFSYCTRFNPNGVYQANTTCPIVGGGYRCPYWFSWPGPALYTALKTVQMMVRRP